MRILISVIFGIKKDSLILTSSYKLDSETKDLVNTTVISNDKMEFTKQYILDNSKIIGLCIKDIITRKKIKQIVITKFEILYILKDALKEIDFIGNLFISDTSNFTYEAYEVITACHKFDKISCYSIASYILELFDKENIKVSSRQEILYTSNFMEENNLTSYSKIYYKSSLKLSPPLTEIDIKDFESFCKVNKYLKSIHYNACSIDGINAIFEILTNNKRKNIKIIVHDNLTSKELINKLKLLKKKCKKEHIELMLTYTKEYIKKNLMKQLVTTTLLVCAFIVLVIGSGSTIYVVLNNIESEKNVESIKSKIEEKIAKDNTKNNKENESIINDPNQEPTKDNKEEVKEKTIIPKMKSLLELNDETVGWLTVPGTNVDYPVVQTKDNDFYLKHNYDKKWDFNGWIFMNYLNNPKDLDKNTIIFGHNIYYSNIMFGTLKNLTKEKWYKEAKNISIYYNTLYDEMEFEVFSVYKINVTVDYLQSGFDNENEFLDFVKMIKERSIFKSSTAIHSDDKILTLSTCLENNQRLVVHAVLKK